MIGIRWMLVLKLSGMLGSAQSIRMAENPVCGLSNIPISVYAFMKIQSASEYYHSHISSLRNRRDGMPDIGNTFGNDMQPSSVVTYPRSAQSLKDMISNRGAGKFRGQAR
jgi:hypothetical protein